MNFSKTPARDRSAVFALAGAIAGASVLVLAWLAASADAHAVGATPAYVALDLAVGFAFVLASLAADRPLTERLLIGAVGPAWLAGSVFPSARSLHQGVLAVALLAFPTGRIAGLPRRLLCLVACVVTLEVVPQVGVAALFGAIAVLKPAATTSRRDAFPYSAAASTAVGAVLVYSWWAVRHSVAMSPLVLYDATLIAVAAGFPLVTRTVARSGAGLADQLLRDADVSGLPGLRLVLAGVLNDAQLEIFLWDATASRYVDTAGHPYRAAPPPGGLAVRNGDELIARVLTTSRALADRPAAEAVTEAVRLAVLNHRLRAQQAQRVAEVEASRTRLLAAADNERERVAARLRSGAGARLQDAHTKLSQVVQLGNPESSAVIDFAAREVAAAAADVQRIIGGTPPHELGSGRLQGAIASLAAHTPAHVTFRVAGDVAAGTDAETALFYVCSEALTNASKHAGASNVVVELQGLGNEVWLSVRDDGRGGADLSGSGLKGLADRLAAAGGRLTVSSPPGAGTTLVASIPQRKG